MLHSAIVVTTTRVCLCRLSDGAALLGVLEAAMYCGKSLARVGLDLRALLATPFSNAVHAALRNNLAVVVALFQCATEAHKWVAMPVTRRQTQEDADATDVSGTHGLLCHPPLAVFMNAVRFASLAIAMCPCSSYSDLSV